MTDQEREELIEKMARHIAVSDDRTPDPNSECSLTLDDFRRARVAIREGGQDENKKD